VTVSVALAGSIASVAWNDMERAPGMRVEYVHVLTLAVFDHSPFAVVDTECGISTANRLGDAAARSISGARSTATTSTGGAACGTRPHIASRQTAKRANLHRAKNVAKGCVPRAT
jgi:hypothetical protein